MEVSEIACSKPVSWLHASALTLHCAAQADKVLQRDSQAAAAAHPAILVPLQEGHLALDLWRSLCSTGAGGQRDDALLLLPPGYELLQPEVSLKLVSQLLWIGRKRRNSVAALTFGAHLPNKKVGWRRAACWLPASLGQCMDLLVIGEDNLAWLITHSDKSEISLGTRFQDGAFAVYFFAGKLCRSPSSKLG